MTEGTRGYSTDRPDEDDRSIGELFSAVTQDLSRLMRQEVELAKSEVRQEVSTAGKAAGMLGGAGVAGWLAVLFLSLMLMYLLENAMDLEWAALIVAVIWAVIGGVLFAVGRRRMATVSPVPERTVETIKEDVRWVQNRSS
ncbi:MAG: phage holin family protein [Jiangellaceae bacterium]|nr:phage holin family protein [Jiangellaceae bacterium]